jgi:hypothetical protein
MTWEMLDAATKLEPKRVVVSCSKSNGLTATA